MACRFQLNDLQIEFLRSIEINTKWSLNLKGKHQIRILQSKLIAIYHLSSIIKAFNSSGRATTRVYLFADKCF